MNLLTDFKKLTYFENYYYSDEIYPHQNYWSNLDFNLIKEKWQELIDETKLENHNFLLHINIPFCETKCSYCTHDVFVWKKEKIDKYLNVLEKEIDYYKSTFKNIKFKHLFIGWGTPSILSSNQLDRLYDILFSNFWLKHLESNMIEFMPNSYSKSKVKVLKKYFVNKVTFWVQDIDSNILKENNRIVKNTDIKEIVDNLRKNNIKHINADIMWGIKWQTFKDFRKTLKYLNSINLSNICLNYFKPTNQTSFVKSGQMHDSKQRELIKKMIKYFNENNTKKENWNLYNFDNPNTSILWLWYWANSHINERLYYKKKSLDKYIKDINWDNYDWFKVSVEDEIIKYIILNLKHNLISLHVIKKIFWINFKNTNIYIKLELLVSKGVVKKHTWKTDSFYKFNSTSDLLFSIYMKIFYSKSLFKELKKYNVSNYEEWLKDYFIN